STPEQFAYSQRGLRILRLSRIPIRVTDRPELRGSPEATCRPRGATLRNLFFSNHLDYLQPIPEGARCGVWRGKFPWTIGGYQGDLPASLLVAPGERARGGAKPLRFAPPPSASARLDSTPPGSGQPTVEDRLLDLTDCLGDL